LKTAAEYKNYADECRALAKQMPQGEQRNQLLQMAETWDTLATEREQLLRRHPEIDTSKNLPNSQVSKFA
jgi:hypothetical protein